ncbi:MAG: alpha/beta hydrolase [Flavipsychrobacter sp.]
MGAVSGYIKTGEEQLHYIKYGEGDKLLIAFHGYGDDASFFAPLAECMDKEYSVISFNLPHHSESQWSPLKLWEKEALNELIANILRLFNVEYFSLLGYSIGGRVCMSVLEQYGDKVDRLVLIASDGLRFNWFYYWLTRTVTGKFIFKSFLTNPALYMPLIDVARKVKLLNEGKYKFAMKYISSEVDRRFLLNVWMTMSKLIPDVGKTKQIIRNEKIATEVFMGRYDKVIPARYALAFAEGVGSAEVTILEKGHRIFDSETLPKIASCFS